MHVPVMFIIGWVLFPCPCWPQVTTTIPLDDYQQVRYVSISTGSDIEGDGSMEKPWKTLQWAMNNILDVSSTNQYAVLVASGTYTASVDPVMTITSHVHTFGGYSPDEWKRDINNNRTVIDGENARRCVFLKSNTGLDGFTITRGRSKDGAGLASEYMSAAIISNNFIINNHATYSGGGFACSGAIVKDNLIADNYAANTGGGVVASTNIVLDDNMIVNNRSNESGGGVTLRYIYSCTVSNNIISDNYAVVEGGGVYCVDSSADLVRNTIINNTAKESGGGVYCLSSSFHGRNNTIKGNESRFGGGFCFVESGSQYLINNIIEGNSAFAEGGGIFSKYSGFTLIGNAIRNNDTKDYGGGIYCVSSSARISGNKIANNSSGKCGGGLYHGGNGSLSFENDVIYGNSSPIGGGFYFREKSYFDPGTVTCINETITGNSAVDGAAAFCCDSSPMFKNCIFWNPGSEINPGLKIEYSCIQGGYPGKGNIDGSPKFLDQKNEDYHLQEGSSCIDGGTGTDSPEMDLDGNLRPLGQEVDIGAYEIPAIPGSREHQPRTWFVQPDAPLNGDGKSWEKAYRTIGEAMRDPDIGTNDQVWVAEGVYHESIIMESTVSLYGGFKGDEITLIERNYIDHPSVIEAKGTNHSAVVISMAGKAAIDGFTIQNGRGVSGGGVYCNLSSPVFANNIIRENSALDDGNGTGWGGMGGAIFCRDSDPIITGNNIVNNSSQIQGGGIFCSFCKVILSKNCIDGNISDYYGGGIYLSQTSAIINDCIVVNNVAREGTAISCYYSPPIIINTTISKNRSTRSGSGIYCLWSAPTIKNSIIWGNGKELNLIDSLPTVSHSDVQGGMYGDKNINLDPLFVDSSRGDFHIQKMSPCKGSGNGPDMDSLVSLYDIDGDPRTGATCDIGADEYVEPSIIWDWSGY